MDDISELLSDPDFVTEFTLKTTGGYRDEGGEWIEQQVATDSSGVVQPAASKDTAFLPDGDKWRQVIKVWSISKITPVNKDTPKLGDKIVWNGKQHRVVNIKDWSQYGYWQAMAVEISGDKDRFGFITQADAYALGETDDPSIGGFWVNK